MGAKLVGRCAVAIVGLAVALPAAAGPGNGIRLGGSDGRLRPSLELELRYDSNAAYSDLKQPESDLVLHVRPGVELKTEGELTAVDAKASLDWGQYLGISSKDTRDLSRLYGDATVGVTVNRHGTLGLKVDDGFRRSSSVQAFTFGTAVISNSNELKVAMPWRPGGGALVVTPTGGWRLETFEPYVKGRLCDPATGGAACDTTKLAKLGYNEYRGALETRWKFLPRTAVVVDGQYFKHVANDKSLGDDGDGIAAHAGIAGLITTHVAGTLKAGYGQASTAGIKVSSWVANAEGEWLPTELTSVKGGYVRELGVDPGQKSGFSSHRLYLDGRTLVGARFTLRLTGSFEARDYPSLSGASVNLLQLQPSVGMELARWLRGEVGYQLTKRSTKLSATAVPLPGYDFTKHEAWLRLTAVY